MQSSSLELLNRRPISHKRKTMGDFNYLHITGVNDLPGYHAAAAFTTKSSEVFQGGGGNFTAPCERQGELYALGSGRLDAV